MRIKRSNYSYLLVLFVYWLILFMWQNINETQTRSSLDIAMKICLMIMLIFESIKVRGATSRIHKANGLIWTLLFCTLGITCIWNIQSVTFSDIIAYSFALIIVFLFVVYLRDLSVTAQEVLKYAKCIIAADLFLVVYCLIFKTEFYTRVFSISDAYGNELSAFLSSSHEFGMYMVFGIFSALWGYRNGGKRRSMRIAYILCIVLFAVHILLSFSRTTMLACSVGMIVFLFVYNKRWFYGVIAVCVVLLLAIWNSTGIREFITNILLKKYNIAGRSNMYGYAWDYFLQSSLIKQLFGNGLSSTSELVKNVFHHDSLHCAYLQVLITGGVNLLAFLIAAIVFSWRNAVKIIRCDRLSGAWAMSLVFTGFAFMLTNTAIYFYSPIDSFMLTVYCIVIPMFFSNGVGRVSVQRDK